MKALKAFIKPFEAPQRKKIWGHHKEVKDLSQYNFLKCPEREGLKHMTKGLTYSFSLHNFVLLDQYCLSKDLSLSGMNHFSFLR